MTVVIPAGFETELGTAADGTRRQVIFVGRETQPVDYWDGE